MRTHRFLLAGLAALAICGTGAVAQAQDAKPAKKLSTEQRLQRMEDIEAIRELMVAYGRNFDKRDFPAYAALFAQDGEWVGGATGVQSYKGPEAIQAMVDKGYQPSVFPGSYHIMSSFDITLTGTDTATGWSRWTFIVRGVHNEPVMFRGGYYDDQFVRAGGVWKFKRRVVATDPPNK